MYRINSARLVRLSCGKYKIWLTTYCCRCVQKSLIWETLNNCPHVNLNRISLIIRLRHRVRWQSYVCPDSVSLLIFNADLLSMLIKSSSHCRHPSIKSIQKSWKHKISYNYSAITIQQYTYWNKIHGLRKHMAGCSDWGLLFGEWTNYRHLINKGPSMGAYGYCIIITLKRVWMAESRKLI